MSSQSVLTLNTKAYNPRGNISGVAKWSLVGDTSFGGAISDVTESVRGPSKDGIYRVLFKLNIPKAAGASSSCACEGDTIANALCNVEVVIPSLFSAAERTDLKLRIQSLVADAVFASAVEDLETSW